MFLQRNTAGQVFTLPGSLRLIADGSAVTTGATLLWVKDGVSAAAGGTLTHVSVGCYTYAPTQAETDAKILGFILSAAAAIPTAGSVRTTNADPNDAAALGLTRLDVNVSSRNAIAPANPTDYARNNVAPNWYAAPVDVSTNVQFLRDMAEGDSYIDTTTTPWTNVIVKKNTATVLARKVMRDITGTGIAAVTTVVASEKDN